MSETDRSRDHFVYRLYDADDQLLYVGCTMDLDKRVRDHRRRQPWGHEIARHEADLPLRFFAAVAREASLIRTLRPRYNIVHNPVRPPRWEPDPECVAFAVRLTSVDRATVRRAMWSGDLPSHDLTREDVVRWIEAAPTNRPARIEQAS